MRRYRSRLFVLTAAGAVATLLMTGTAAAAPTPKNTGAAKPGQPAGAQANTAASSDPAPPGFTQQLADIFAQAGTLIQQYPPSTGVALPSQSSFQAQVAGLTQDQLNQLYDFDPGVWDQAQSALDSANSSASAVQPDVKAPNTAKPNTAKPNTAKPNSAQPQTAGNPDFPAAPTLVTCADEATFEGLHAASFALGEASAALNLAADVLTFVIAFVPHDLVALGETVDADPAYTVLVVIQNTLTVAADAVDIAQNAIDFTAGQIADCYGVYSTQESDYIFEAIQALGTIGEQSLTNEANISASIDTGFAQTYQKLANLQTSVNTAQASLDLALKQRIESALLGATTSPLTDFELPNSAGGYLDANPIGVKVIVTDALAAMKANAQAVGSTAPKLLTLANGYLATGKYKKAFAEYQLAYQAIAQP